MSTRVLTPNRPGAVGPLVAPYPWFGGKRTVAADIWARLGDVTNYVEPFFGSGAVLLNRPHVGKTETINDKDRNVSNFWRAVQHDPEAVAHYLDWPVNECVPAGTRIAVPGGSVAVEDVKPGMTVLGECGGRVVPTVVVGTRKSIAWEFYSVGSLLLTGNHPVWTAESGYLAASSLGSGMTVALLDYCSSAISMNTLSCTHERARLADLCTTGPGHDANPIRGGHAALRGAAVHRASFQSKKGRENPSGLLDSLNPQSSGSPYIPGDREGVRSGLARCRAALDSALQAVIGKPHGWRRRNAGRHTVDGVSNCSINRAGGNPIPAGQSIGNAWQEAHAGRGGKDTAVECGAAPYGSVAHEVVEGAVREAVIRRSCEKTVSEKVGDDARGRAQEENRCVNDGAQAGRLSGDGGGVPLNHGSGAGYGRIGSVDIRRGSEGIPLQGPVASSSGVAVYNFQTVTANYFANDILVHNCDLTARHLWLLNEGARIIAACDGDPDFFDAKAAGYWAWGACSWIGSGWCSGEGPWSWDAEAGDWSKLPHLGAAGRGIKRKLPHLGDAGRGINRQLPHLGDAGRGAFILDWIQSLADRLRHVRVCCGDWERVCGPSVTHRHGLTGIFLDPPYADTAGRTEGLYATDSPTVAHDAREWAIAEGRNSLMRVVFCGYSGEHVFPADWDCVAWKARGGFGSQGDGKGRENSGRERLWFSPACLPRVSSDLFGNLAT